MLKPESVYHENGAWSNSCNFFSRTLNFSIRFFGYHLYSGGGRCSEFPWIVTRNFEKWFKFQMPKKVVNFVIPIFTPSAPPSYSKSSYPLLELSTMRMPGLLIDVISCVFIIFLMNWNLFCFGKWTLDSVKINGIMNEIKFTLEMDHASVEFPNQLKEV